MTFIFQPICLFSHNGPNLWHWNMPKTLPPHLSEIICVVQILQDRLVEFLKGICKMSSHVSTEQLHYDENYISIAYYVISSGETMPYILLSVAMIMKQEKEDWTRVPQIKKKNNQ